MTGRLVTKCYLNSQYYNQRILQKWTILKFAVNVMSSGSVRTCTANSLLIMSHLFWTVIVAVHCQEVGAAKDLLNSLNSLTVAVIVCVCMFDFLMLPETEFTFLLVIERRGFYQWCPHLPIKYATRFNRWKGENRSQSITLWSTTSSSSFFIWVSWSTVSSNSLLVPNSCESTTLINLKNNKTSYNIIKA